MKVLTFVVIALAPLSRVGRHARHLDGLRQAGRHPPRCCRSSPSSGWSAAPAGPCRFSGESERHGCYTKDQHHQAQVRRRHRRRRRLRHARLAATGARRPQRGRALQGVPDALAHRRRAGRHRRLARQHERRQLALPLLRHRSRAPTGSATRTRSSSCAAKRRRSSTSSNTSACRSTATRTARSTSARSAATPPTTARSRCSAPAPRPTAPATRCCTRCTSRTSRPRRSSSSNGWRST